MSENRKEEKKISEQNWNAIEKISIRVQEVQYLLRLFLVDEESNPAFFIDERNSLKWSCVDLLGNIVVNLTELQHCIRNGTEFSID